MGYKCRICGINEVDNPGEMCELCAIGQDPYAQNQTFSYGYQAPAQHYSGSSENNDSYIPKRGSNRKVLLNGGASFANQDPYGNDISEDVHQSQVQVYSPGHVPQVATQQNTVSANTDIDEVSGNQPITSGITKNISLDNQKKSILAKWFRALFSGIPFTMDDDVTMFQVFPDFSGTALNAFGNACDQVIVYGKLNKGAISENNDVEIYGHRDSNNNIIAKTIKNKASGTIITPARTMGPIAVWIITMIVILVLAITISSLGIEGVIWTIILILCLTNFPVVLKILSVVAGGLFSIIKRLF